MTRKDINFIAEAYSSFDPNLEDTPTGPGWSYGEYDPTLENAINLADGIYVEVEHTTGGIGERIKSIPKEELVKIIHTVLDHLNETPDYYTKLKKAGL